MKPHSENGVSLLEALVCLALIVLLTGLAIPSFTQWTLSYKHRTNLDAMISILNFARSQAISTDQTVTLCSATNCSDQQYWEGQIIVFQDAGQIGKFDAGLDTIFKTLELEPEDQWLWKNFRNKSFLSFKPNGTTFSLNGTLDLCVSNAKIYSIKINTAGRARSIRQPSPSKCIEETVSAPIKATHPQKLDL